MAQQYDQAELQAKLTGAVSLGTVSGDLGRDVIGQTKAALGVTDMGGQDAGVQMQNPVMDQGFQAMIAAPPRGMG